MKGSPRVAAIGLALIATMVSPALAGPPLVCHPVDIDDARSLPWDGAEGWRDVDDVYDVARLERDLASLLRRDTPVLVRMKTIRRAAIYASKDPEIARSLLERFTELAESAGPGKAAVLFDYGYLVATYRQVPETMPRGGDDGYAVVLRAIELAGGDAAMEFAAALITAHPRRSSHREHLRAALAGAEEGSLLERNLVEHFGERGQTVAGLRASAGLPAWK
jgi:hypothetical protein